MLASLAPLARLAPAVLAKVADALVPGTGEVVRRIHEWYCDNREKAEKAEILKALQITEEKLNAFDSMFIILGKECGDLLARVTDLEKQGQDSSDEIAREVLMHPEVQERFDSLDLQVSLLEDDVRRLDGKYASLSAFANELKAKQLTDTELADFRAFRQAKRFQAAGRFAESESLLLKLAQTQPKSAAVAVAQAVAKHNDPAAFDDALRRAVRLRPDDRELKPLANAATVAVTRGRTPAIPSAPAMFRVPQPGDTLDGWRLETRLGGGGWGIVFRATKKGQTKAVKVMRPDLTRQAEFVEAFRDEVKNLKRLRHANCITIEENWFCTAFQCHYFVMPLLSGSNLEQHLAKHGVPPTDVAMTWLRSLLDGLEHAHANGLIHRDIKPQNVMIQTDNTPVLIDFGIAGLDGVPGHTQAIGKSSFFAPPELHSLGQADKRSDLFMLAATFFYAFRYNQPVESRAHFEFDGPLVPPGFRRAFKAALSVRRKLRPATPAAFRELLGSVRRASGARAATPPRPNTPAPQSAAAPSIGSGSAVAREPHLLAQANVERWKTSGEPERWVRGRLSGWSEESLNQYLDELRRGTRFWPLLTADVRQHLEIVRERMATELRQQEEQAKQERDAVRLRPQSRREPKAEFGEGLHGSPSAEAKAPPPIPEPSRAMNETQATSRPSLEPQGRLQCPSCPKVLKFNHSAAGRTGKCPNCRALFVIPGEPDKSSSTANSVEPRRKAGERMEIRLSASVPITFAWCPPGTFLMGSPASEPGRGHNERQHEVHLTNGFWVGVFPLHFPRSS